LLFHAKTVARRPINITLYALLTVLLLLIWEQNERHKPTDMLNGTADGTDFAAAERFTGQNLYVTPSVNSEIVAALAMKPNGDQNHTLADS
jgi:hypothetical protein